MRNFFHRIILIGRHCERKISAGFVKTAFYFSGEFLSKTILEVVELVFFLVLARFFKHGLPKLHSTCPEALFAEFFSQIQNNWHCERKNSAGFVKTAFYFSGELLSKTILEVVDLVFFLVLARFFKHGLPKLCSTCPEPFFAEFFSQNHINWHCERRNSAGFVKTAFHFSGELLSKTILEVVELVFFSSPCQILQAWGAKTVFYVSRGTFCGIFFAESY